MEGGGAERSNLGDEVGVVVHCKDGCIISVLSVLLKRVSAVPPRPLFCSQPEQAAVQPPTTHPRREREPIVSCEWRMVDGKGQNNTRTTHTHITYTLSPLSLSHLASWLKEKLKMPLSTPLAFIVRVSPKVAAAHATHSAAAQQAVSPYTLEYLCSNYSSVCLVEFSPSDLQHFTTLSVPFVDAGLGKGKVAEALIHRRETLRWWPCLEPPLLPSRSTALLSSTSVEVT
jgi:hypothetical protein